MFIDNPFYWEMAMERDVDLGEIVGEYFETLSNHEYEELLK
ncbi:hypothetical protein [Ureibacillus chungkukjangi]|nr:hypothetical protein [Ureibacillus chungkukjangi]